MASPAGVCGFVALQGGPLPASTGRSDEIGDLHFAKLTPTFYVDGTLADAKRDSSTAAGPPTLDGKSSPIARRTAPLPAHERRSGLPIYDPGPNEAGAGEDAYFRMRPILTRSEEGSEYDVRHWRTVS